MLEKIARSAHQGGKIIRNLRAIAERQIDQPEKIEICSLIRDVAKLAQLDGRSESFRFKLKLPSRLPFVLADAIQLQQVILNLIRNALDAMEHAPKEQKTVTISATMPHHDYLEVAVKDRGSGLSESVAEKLYDPFFTTKDLGMGLGLTVAQSIVAAYDGRLWFTRNRKRGTTFHFTLPIVLGPQA